MRSLKLLLTVPEKGTADGEFQVTPDGGQAGQLSPYFSKLPFCDPERRRTLLKALGAVEFRLKDFKPEELDWMVEVGLVTEERNDFHNDLQKVIGQAIYESLFPEERKEARQLLQRALAQAGAREQLHIQIEFSQYVERRGRLPDYPWELAHDGDQFLARKQVVFSRFIAFLENTPNLPPVEKINVLLVSSTAYDRSLGLKPLLPSESNAIYEALTKTEQDQETDKKISVTRLESPTFKDFGDYLTENRREKAPHIIHFDGHGFFGKRCDYCLTMHKKVSDRECRECGKSLQDKSFQGYLLFEPDEDCKQNADADYVSAQEIAEQLQKVSLEQSEAHGLRLVVMSACKTGMALGSDSVFNGVAQRLIQHQVPAVVAMQYNVTVGGAKAFSERFYRAICNKFPITQAVSLGQNAMREGNQWYRPVLYLRWHDNEGGQLFAYTEAVSEVSLSREQVLQNTVVLEPQVSCHKLSLAQRLEKESLEKDLAARQKDYEGVAEKLRWETAPIEQNSLEAKRKKLINEIKRIEQELEKLKNSSQTSSQAEIITIQKFARQVGTIETLKCILFRAT